MKRAEMQNDLAMTVGLVSASMLFVTLLMGYGIYRSSAPAWPPAGFNPVSLLWPVISTLIIFVSSWFCHQVVIALRANNFASAHKHLNITIALGVGFMCSQLTLWADLKQTGLFVSSGIYSSILYGFTWIHAAHVIGGLLTLIYLKMVMKPATRLVQQKARNVEKFWHFLGLVWAVMFIVLFAV